MSRIKILPPSIANKIAAGEVVDRPAAVVKELVENSLDAGATHITVVLEKAGKELIQVIDNGCGIPPEEIPLAFERHATSKIETVSDLDRIITLGFRGEALPSIASVARVELKTRTPEQQTGLQVSLEGGKISDKSEIALKPGTIISVKNLFYNTPARRNFLRSDTAEFNHIHKTLKRFFIGYPEIGFQVIHNEKELYNLTACSLDERLTQVFGEKFYEGLVYVREELNEIELEGYVCRPDFTRGNNENQFIFLNKRAIQNRNLNHAVFQGYGNLIDRSQYPQFVMLLTIPPYLVDVNVHPTKMEVRFSNERVIYHLFLSAVRKAIQTKEMVPQFSLNDTDLDRKEIDRQFKLRSYPTARRSPFSPGKLPTEAEKNQMTFSYTIPPQGGDSFEQREADFAAPEEETPLQPALWQIHRRYILSQIKSGLVIIDQHVAHERILYEKILKYLSEEKPLPSQKLLFPQTLEMALEDYLVFSEIKDWLHKIGFSITELSGRTILIEAIPSDVRVGYEGKVLLEIIDYYRENEGTNYPPHEKIAAAFACKNAIKSGEKLNQREMTSLVDRLFATNEPYFCPHGRPVIVTLSLEEIDKKFKRS
ncbi:MAG: DNA mismatch repair endonuclease MutL [Calditrichia bacterium]